jgi:uncharacterized protein
VNRPHLEPGIAVGIGLRAPHYRDLQAHTANQGAPVDFLEVHSENFFGAGGQPLAYLEWFREIYPLSLHGVGLSIGSADPLNPQHLANLKRLVERFEPTLVSEHLCWSSIGGRFLNDLLPVPYTNEMLKHVVSRVDAVQTMLARPILVENVSSYLEFADSTIPEWEFVGEVARRAGCRVLLDVNNIYVNSINHGFDADAYLNAIPIDAVGEIHLAGYQDTGEILIDTHGDCVSAPVWGLYQRAISRFGPVPTLIEWDTDLPSLDTLLDEAKQARAILAAHVKEPFHD